MWPLSSSYPKKKVENWEKCIFRKSYKYHATHCTGYWQHHNSIGVKFGLSIHREVIYSYFIKKKKTISVVLNSANANVFLWRTIKCHILIIYEYVFMKICKWLQDIVCTILNPLSIQVCCNGGNTYIFKKNVFVIHRGY